MINPSENTWHNLSDPSKHNEKFQYLVHAVKSPNDMSSLITTSFMQKGASNSESSNKLNINFLGNKTLEETLREKISGRALATSLIDNENDGLWSNQGLILRINNPDRDIIATGSSDLGSLVYSLKAVREQFVNNPIMSPQKLLANTYVSYNEVVISGEYPADIRVEGVIVKVDRNDKPLDDYGIQLERKAEKEGLPVIRIKQRASYSLDGKLLKNGDMSYFPKDLPSERQDEIISMSYFDNGTQSKKTLVFCGFKYLGSEDGGLYTVELTQSYDDGCNEQVAFMKMRLSDNATSQELIRVADKLKATEMLETLKTKYSDCFQSNRVASGGITREGISLIEVFDSVYRRVME